jgi:hypothetical protein
LRSARTLDLLLRVFVSKTSYLLLIDAYLIARVGASSSSLAGRLLAPLLLVVPAFYAWRFTSRASASVRRRLFRALTADRVLRLAAALETLAVLAVLASAAAPASWREALAGAAALSALVGRLALAHQVSNADRASRGAPARAAFGASSLWMIAFALILCAAALVLVGAQGKANTAVYPVGAAFVAGAFAVARAARRRSTARL